MANANELFSVPQGEPLRTVAVRGDASGYAQVCEHLGLGLWIPIYEVKSNNDFQKYESLIWAGGNIATNLLEIEKFKINSKLTLGGTSLGGLIKPNLLLAYEIKNNVSISAGLEGTMLIYTNNQKILQTTKLALVYGISVGL